jgi:hypothetical protein
MAEYDHARRTRTAAVLAILAATVLLAVYL